jgi:Tol biopolymer transport system component
MREPVEPRSAELTRPLKLGRAAIITGIVLTALLVVILGLGVGRDTLGIIPRAASPARIELNTEGVGASGGGALTRQIAITPDGSGVVFVMKGEGGQNVLAYQPTDSGSAVIIPGTEGVVSPELSGNRTVIGISEGPTSTQRVKVGVKGGTPSIEKSEPDPRREALEAEGLRVQQMLNRNRSALVVRAQPGRDAGPAIARDIKAGTDTRVLSEDIVGMRSAAGILVYVKPNGTMWAAPFDEEKLRVTGNSVRIATHVAITGDGVAQFDISKNGSVAYMTEGPRSLVFVTREGILRDATSERQGFSSPRFSPDGEKVSFDFSDSTGRDIWIARHDSGALSRATFERDAHDAAWTPDGKFLTFTSFRRGSLGIYRASPGSRAAPDSLFTAPPLVYSGEWLKDGSGLITTASNLAPNSGLDVAFIDSAGRGPIVPVVVDEYRARFPSVSPDGKWLAFVSDRSGRDEIYVRSRVRGGATARISQRGGTEPVWSPSGVELYYKEAASGFLVAAMIRADSTIRGGMLTYLFSVRDMVPGVTHANYDISPNGWTLVMVRRSLDSRVHILRNVPEMIQKR